MIRWRKSIDENYRSSHHDLGNKLYFIYYEYMLKRLKYSFSIGYIDREIKPNKDILDDLKYNRL